MKSIADQIKDLQAARAAKAGEASDVLQKGIDGDRSTTEDESELFDALDLEIKQIDEDLKRLNRMQVLNGQSAKEVTPEAGQSKAAASESRGAPTIFVKSQDQDEKFEGQTFIRSVIAKALAKTDGVSAVN